MLNVRIIVLSLAVVMTGVIGFSGQANAKLQPVPKPSPALSSSALKLDASLSKDLNEFMAINADLFARVGRNPAKNGRSYAAVIRCSDPQETGHAEDRAYCEAEVIGNSALTEDVKSESLTAKLLSVMKDTKKFYGGSAQGWMGFEAEISCVTPKNGVDGQKPVCLAETAMNDQARDGAADIDDAGAED